MRVYEAIVKGLEGVGVQAAFGGAGENAASLMLALEDSKKIRPIMTRNEQAASFMACGYAMYTNRLGFCFATAGPGRSTSSPASPWPCPTPIRSWRSRASQRWSGAGRGPSTKPLG